MFVADITIAMFVAVIKPYESTQNFIQIKYV